MRNGTPCGVPFRYPLIHHEAAAGRVERHPAPRRRRGGNQIWATMSFSSFETLKTGTRRGGTGT
ncbi:MAG: hypothetical protein AABZ94_09240, partial [Candidatus Eisenbacteria bacterium]